MQIENNINKGIISWSNNKFFKYIKIIVWQTVGWISNEILSKERVNSNIF